LRAIEAMAHRRAVLSPEESSAPVMVEDSGQENLGQS